MTSIARLQAQLRAHPDDLESALALARAATRHHVPQSFADALCALARASAWSDLLPLLDTASTPLIQAVYARTHTAVHGDLSRFRLALLALYTLTPRADIWLREHLEPRPLHGWCALVARHHGIDREALLALAIPWIETLVSPSRLYAAFTSVSLTVGDLFTLNPRTRALLDAELERACDAGLVRYHAGHLTHIHCLDLPPLPNVTCLPCLDSQQCSSCQGRGQRVPGTQHTRGRRGPRFVLCEACTGSGRCEVCAQSA